MKEIKKFLAGMEAMFWLLYFMVGAGCAIGFMAALETELEAASVGMKLLWAFAAFICGAFWPMTLPAFFLVPK